MNTHMKQGVGSLITEHPHDVTISSPLLFSHDNEGFFPPHTASLFLSLHPHSHVFSKDPFRGHTARKCTGPKWSLVHKSSRHSPSWRCWIEVGCEEKKDVSDGWWQIYIVRLSHLGLLSQRSSEANNEIKDNRYTQSQANNDTQHNRYSQIPHRGWM